ncbi:T9SS type A sorting domain-containing protein [Spirosoma litoris]
MKPTVLFVLLLLSGSVFAQTYESQLNLNQPISAGMISEQKATETIMAHNAVRAGAVALFTAGQSVSLQPGFVAQAGSVFVASVDRVVSSPTTSDVPDLLLRAYPNPFAESTTVEYNVPKSGPVEHTLTDLQGQVLRQSSDPTEQSVGIHQTQVDGRNLPTGVYLYRVQVGKESQTLRLVKKP